MTTNRRDVLKGIAAGTTALASGMPAGASSPDEQFRAYWADAFNEGIYTPEQVTTLVEEASATNHNAIVAQVVRRGDFFGDDALPPRTEAPIADGFDPLAALVKEAHAAGIEVHAWMVVNQMWNRATPPEADDHAFNQHGPDSDDPWTSVRADGADHAYHRYFFDLGHPGAAEYLVEVARSIVENYDVDGINLDYIRYPDYHSQPATQTWGYNEVALERFREQTGREGVPEADDPEFEQWRRDQVTNLVRRIYLACFDADPSVRLSADTITWWKGPQARAGGWEATGAYFVALQDWPAWMEEGILDLNIPMNYKREHSAAQAEMYRDWSDFAKDHQYDRQAAIGSALYLNSIEGSVDQIHAALAPSDAGNEAVGWVGYSYANPDLAALRGQRSAAESRAELRQAVTEGDGAVFAEPASVPEMPWKTRPEHGHLSGVVATDDGEPFDDLTVQVRRRGEVVHETTTDGNGWFGVVDLDPGRYTVSLVPGEVAGQQRQPIEIRAGELADADFEVQDTVPADQ